MLLDRRQDLVIPKTCVFERETMSKMSADEMRKSYVALDYDHSLPKSCKSCVLKKTRVADTVTCSFIAELPMK
jgi:hypothetical protein